MYRSDKKLKDGFYFVRKHFFPKWDRTREWQVRVVDNLPSMGRYDPESKAVLVNSIPDCDDELLLLLIHEISPAVTTLNHGKLWLDRMSRASVKARMMGRHGLTAMIDSQCAAYESWDQGIVVDSKLVYRKIEDCIVDHPDADYDTVVRLVSHYLGLYPEELEARYTKCHKTYERMKKRRREQREIRRRYREKSMMQHGNIK